MSPFPRSEVRPPGRQWLRLTVLAVLLVTLAPLAESLSHEEGGLLGDPDCGACHQAAACRAAVVPDLETLASVRHCVPGGVVAAASAEPRSFGIPTSIVPRAPPQRPA